MKGKLIKKSENHYDLHVNGVGLYTSTYQWTSNGNLLSLKNCQAIERGYDLDELFNEVDESIDYHEFDFTSFRLGFQKALEILGDRRFTEEDVRLFMDRVWGWCNGSVLDQNCSTMAELKDKYIQSLQQNEWEVYIITEPLQGEINGGTWVAGGTKRLKLDAGGCINLKRAK